MKNLNEKYETGFLKIRFRPISSKIRILMLFFVSIEK
jgi:hypothetical protein